MRRQSVFALVAAAAILSSGERPALANAGASIVIPTAGGGAWATEDVAKLDADIDRLLESAPALAAAHVGVIASATDTGQVLYRKNVDQEFQPASTLKLVVGSAALDVLGAEFQFKATAKLFGDPPDGDTFLEVEPNADPLLGSHGVDELASEIARRTKHLTGVTIHNGPPIAPYPGGWTFDDFAEDYAPPIGMSVFEKNVIHLHVVPDAVTKRVNVSLSPNLPVVASAGTGCASSDRFLIVEAATGRPGTEDTLDVEPRGGCRALIGSLPVDSKGDDIDVAVPDPAVYLGAALIASLRLHGVSTGDTAAVDGGGRLDGKGDPIVHPDDLSQPVWTSASRPLREILAPFWITSDNFIGEELLLHLGARLQYGFVRPVRDEALERERTWLAGIGVDPATTTLADGSGLSQYDRITPRDLVTILQHDWNGPNRQIVLDSLPIGGARGTIEGIAGTPAAGRVFAKTGSMMHVRGLAGYLATQRHGAVTFAFEVDDWIGDYKDLAATRAAVLSRIITSP